MDTNEAFPDFENYLLDYGSSVLVVFFCVQEDSCKIDYSWIVNWMNLIRKGKVGFIPLDLEGM